MKPVAFVLAVMVGLLVAAMAGVSVATGDLDWLIGTAVGLGIAALILAIEVPLLIWAFKRWGQW